MSSSHQVELEAAKFLHKLIQDSKDEPSKLAEKLYMILGHMKMSGKEQSLPYQVISRAMETVVSQHKIDIEALKSSRLTMGNIPQIGDSSQGARVREKSKEESLGQTSQNIRSSESKEAAGTSDPAKMEYLRQNTLNRGSFAQSLEHESSSSVPMEDSSAASDAPPGRKEVKKKGNAKRKRADSKESSEVQGDDLQQLDSASTRFSSWKGKQSARVSSVAQSRLSSKDGDHSHAEPIQQGTQFGQGSETKQQFKGISEREENPLPSQKIENPSNYPRLATNMPFKEQHLKQLRAQCLVFLAFRNNVPPRKLHLEIALGEKYPKEDGNQQGSGDARASQVETESSSKDTEKNNQSKAALEQTLSSSKQKTESEYPGKSIENDANRIYQQENSANQNFPSSLRKSNSNIAVPHSIAMTQQEVATGSGVNPKQSKPFVISERKKIPANLEFPILETNMVRDRSPSLSATNSHAADVGNPKIVVNSLRELQHEKPSTTPVVAVHENKIGLRGIGMNGLDGERTSEMQKQSMSSGLKTIIFCNESRGGALERGTERSIDHDDDSSSMESLDTPLSAPQFSTSEKWIIVQKKRKNIEEQEWVSKQMKAEKRIAACFDKLKENVNASEDISAKTKSVIELKKLQLLQVQRRLRSEFLSDFFKPISSEMEHLKSVKKHKHPRKIKQLERFELKMKEERQKRIRERQKEFFGEVEAHKERLDDYFKIKRERFKGINRYIKEFHKRKERIHREKIDRIQREKINLLKANDVEGYLRMVQDAKSDRVKQLLKETEKYLQKLGAKIKEAKCASRLFGEEMGGLDVAMTEKNESFRDLGNENDQAQNYLESNEKYYLLAHSVKETIEEQPASLRGGKLREYQMNGLRWLVSLYNNHLNGILADEMGLGKTVQVISLICYLMETKNDRGPFLVVVPSSVLPGWDSEISFWAPGINKIMYAGTPEERRRLFKERIAHQKFNVLLTTYEYLMNKHDRPKLSKIDWHYVIIDEGHRIKNASCKLNADLKHYRSNHRLLLTGTPLQNNLEELWALLNFLLPNIFNSAEDFSQWFNKPFQSNNDGSADEALLSEEENLLIINRLHQVLRPFVLRRLKHKVENELPEKIERLVRCEASAYQKLLMKRVEDNLGSIGNSKGRSVHNTVMELRNICNHPYLSQLHADEVDALLPKHYLPPLVRLCGKMEMVDRLLPKLRATGHRVLFFSTMTRLLDVMEEYLHWKNYRYLRLDGHTSGSDRGALIEEFNRPDSSTFIFLLSIRAGGVGVNLQAADTVLIFDTDWNPQVDLQAQARAHRIGQKRDVLVLRLETVNTVEEQVRAAAEHKLGVANQSITAGFFDNNTSAEDRREYLESLLRECKKEEAAPVLDDDALNDLLARSEEEIDVFESIDQQRRELEAATWQKLTHGRNIEGQSPLPMPPRLVTEEDLEPLYKVFHLSDTPVITAKRKRDASLDTQHYGRGKRTREVRSYEDQWTEEEFEKLCQAESPVEPFKEGILNKDSTLPEEEDLGKKLSPGEPQPVAKENLTPVKRGRGRPKRLATDTSLPCEPSDTMVNLENVPSAAVGDFEHLKEERETVEKTLLMSTTVNGVSLCKPSSKVQCRKTPTGEASRGRGKKSSASARVKAGKCSPASFNAQSLEQKEESSKETAKETSIVLPSPLTSTQESQATEVLDGKHPEAEPTSTSPALIINASETKVSITRKKAAAREARNTGGLKMPHIKQKPADNSEGISGISFPSHMQDHDRDVQKGRAISFTCAKEKNSSLADMATSSGEKDSKTEEIKESTVDEEFTAGNVHNLLERTSDREENIAGISLVVQLNGDKITQPSLITAPFSDSLAAGEHRLEASHMSDQICKSEQEDGNSLTHDISGLENRSIASALCVDLVNNAEPIIDAHVEMDGLMENCYPQCKNMMLAQNCDDLADVAETNTPVCRDAIRDNDLSSPEICPADATHAKDEYIDVNALPEDKTGYGASCIQHDDKNHNCDVSVPVGHPGDPMCTKVEDKNEDCDALPLEGREAVAACSKGEGVGVSHALLDKNEEHSASASIGHATDAACIYDNDNNVDMDKNQDIAASVSESHSEDATCIKGNVNNMPAVSSVLPPSLESVSTTLNHCSNSSEDGHSVDLSLKHNFGAVILSSEQPIADVDNLSEQPIAEKPIIDVDNSMVKPPVADADTSSPEKPVAGMDDSCEQVVVNSGTPPEKPIADVDYSSAARPVADLDTLPPEKIFAAVDNSSLERAGADVENPPKQPSPDVDNTSTNPPVANVEHPHGQLIADTDNTAEPNVADVESPHEQHTADVDNASVEPPVADVDNSSLEQTAADVENPIHQPVADVDYSCADTTVADVRNPPEQPLADMHNMSGESPVADGENLLAQPTAGMENTSAEPSVADMGISSLEQSSADVESSHKQPIAVMENTSAERHISDEESPPGKPIAEVDDTSAEPSAAHVDNSSLEQSAVDVESPLEKPIAEVDNTSAEPSVADVGNSSLEQSAVDVESPLEKPIADVDNTSAETPVADVDNSSMESAADMENPLEKRISDVDNMSAGPAVAEVDNSSLEESAADVENPLEQPITDVDNTSADPPVAEEESLHEQPIADVDNGSAEPSVAVVNNSSLEQAAADVEDPVERSIADMDYSSVDTPVADVESRKQSIAGVDNTSADPPFADMDNSCLEEVVVDAENHTEQTIADVDSTSQPPVADVEFSELPLAADDNTSAEPTLDDVGNSSLEVAAEAENPEQTIADVDCSSAGPPAADMESPHERLSADVENASAELPIADVDNSSLEQAAADVENPPGLIIADVEDHPQPIIADVDNESAGPPIADMGNLSLEQDAADVEIPPEPIIADTESSYAVADVENHPELAMGDGDGSSLVADADCLSPQDPSLKHAVADMGTSSPELVSDMGNSGRE